MIYIVEKKMDKPEYLYKYTTCEAAYQILSSCYLKWSCPTEFNDPFDCKAVIHSFSVNEYSNAMLAVMRDECYGKGQMRIPPNSGHYKQVKKFRNQTKRIKDESFKTIENNILNKIPNMFNKYSKELSDNWEEYRKIHVILCLSKPCDSKRQEQLLLWSHYADGHKGVVFKFKNTGNNSVVGMSKRVDYSEEIYALSKDPQKAVEEVLEIIDNSYNDEAEEALLSKGKVWAYENEYRCIEQFTSPIPKSWNKGMYEFKRFDPQELDEIVFGYNMNKEIQEELKNLLVEDFKHVKTLKAVLDNNKHELHYELC